MKKFMVRSGWDVITLTSSFGRPRIYIEPKYTYENYKSIVRGTVQLGRRHYFGPEALAVAGFNFLARSRRNGVIEWLANRLRSRELRWTKAHVRTLAPSLVVKCFDVEGAGEFRSAFQGVRLHLIGFLNHDEYSLSQNRIVANHSNFGSNAREKEVISSDPFSGTLGLGFSSRFDRDRIARTSVNASPLYIGIGFEPRFSGRSPDTKIVLFVGNRTMPNHRSIEYFLAEIWPTVRGHVPDAQLRVVGRVCQYLSDAQPGVHLVGEVADLQEEYSRAQVIVAPLVTGSAGVKTKVAEGFRYGRVVVTTSLGVDPSLPDQFDGAALIADTPQDYAAATIRVLTDASLRTAMEVRSEEIFMKNFSSEHAYSDFSRWIQQCFPPDLGRVEAR
ncbi:glycosyltransferase family 4 protein [Methylobacterium sp. P31]